MADDLPAWAPTGDQPAAAAQPANTGATRSRRTWLLTLLAGLLLLAAVAGGFVLASSGDETATDADAVADDSSAGGEAPSGDVASVDDTGDGSTDAESAESAGDGEAEADGESAAEAIPSGADDADGEPPVDNSDGSIRFTRLEGGKVYLEGVTPDQETKDATYEATIAVADPENVVNNLVVDPTSPTNVVGYPVIIADVVLFEFNSSDVSDDSKPILDGMTAFMMLDDRRTITIEAYTDSVGSAESNLKLAAERAGAVKAYMVGQGGDTNRILLQPLGEVEASEDESDDEAAANRRVEFQLGVLD